jgi:hypothetical protein
MKSILFFLKGIVAALAHDVGPAVKNFFLLSIRNLCRCFHRKKKGIVRRHSCAHVAHPAFKRPDPMIYDQYYLMSLGLAVSWQNPDIQILHNGVPVSSAYDLQTSTTYTIKATIYNASTEGIVYNMPVVFSYLSFGIETKSNLIPGPSPTVTLGVKGTPEAVAVAEMDWTTPSTPGHYCVQVSFSWFDDLNPFNNLGQENTRVLQAASPAQIVFQLRNSARVRREFRFELDMFQIPPQPPCPDTRGTGRAGKNRGRGGKANVTEAVRQRNSRANNPLPAGWAVVFSPTNPVLDPDEEITVTGTISPPDTFHGTLPVNVHAFSGAALIGGMTMIVNRA